MQQTQQNYRRMTGAILILLSAVTAAGAVSSAASDPLLTGEKGACDARPNDPNYVPDSDVLGNPVAPADLPQPKLIMPDGILVPLGKTPSGATKGWASLDQKQLDSLLNTGPDCQPKR